jgi:hypothetical protein
MAGPGPSAVFDLVGTGAGAGWLFDTTCDRLARVPPPGVAHAPSRLVRRRACTARRASDRVADRQVRPRSVFATATENLATMAVDEIRGSRVRLTGGDDGTDPSTGHAAEARCLVRAGCRAILATTTSATFARVAQALRPDGVLPVHTVMNEGGLGSSCGCRWASGPAGS